MKKILLFSFIIFISITDSNAQFKPLFGRTFFKIYVSDNTKDKSAENIPKNTEVEIVDVSENSVSIIYKNKIISASMDDITYNRLEFKEFKKMINSLKTEGIYNREVENYMSGKKNNLVSDKKIIEISDPLKYEIDHIRYCAGKYNKEIMAGYSLTIIGSVVSAGGAFLDEPEVPMIVGGCMALIGSIVIIDSQKWMKKMYFGPNGVGVKFNF